MRFVNLTPHVIRIQHADGSREEIPPSGTVARLAQHDEVVDALPGGVRVLRTVTGEPVGVPPERIISQCQCCGQSGCGLTDCCGLVVDVLDHPARTAYLVSAMMLPALKGRTDIYAPATGPTHGAIRDGRGQVEAVTALQVPDAA